MGAAMGGTMNECVVLAPELAVLCGQVLPVVGIELQRVREVVRALQRNALMPLGLVFATPILWCEVDSALTMEHAIHEVTHIVVAVGEGELPLALHAAIGLLPMVRAFCEEHCAATPKPEFLTGWQVP
eukprot:CAMPEP_0174332328 /NCGR_PEP_ID=MMETSP0810-20121108/18210_1 /TAXON_ID=73025 ORGANISM="Eutreptiella gymnastica-like, Strain CCMP1594" /NCGR_SAMPLE_ID=MMETSP0810 /ASSEMBLY_ACC=CAM_ASM_000659 /LENGTH=127 /DNA_ID=CAMNT_0015448671 /DNA_START=90 /DNA_END=473 /DNA_ORIENTATION=-